MLAGQLEWMQASDPGSSGELLHYLAQNFPELRPLIAKNPATYPDLLAWLFGLGDPHVNAALIERHQTSYGQGTPTPESIAVVVEPRKKKTVWVISAALIIVVLAAVLVWQYL